VIWECETKDLELLTSMLTTIQLPVEYNLS
jgi:hypothetical protein